MRSEIVKVNDKDINVKELKIKDFLALKDEFLKEDKENINNKQVLDLVKENINKLVPELTEEDLLESYPSEIEQVVEKFIEVNFTGIKKVIGIIGKDTIKNMLQSFFKLSVLPKSQEAV